jgi:hypothetical protein
MYENASAEELDRLIRKEEKKLKREGARSRKKGLGDGRVAGPLGIDQCVWTQILIGIVVLCWIGYVLWTASQVRPSGLCYIMSFLVLRDDWALDPPGPGRLTACVGCDSLPSENATRKPAIFRIFRTPSCPIPMV